MSALPALLELMMAPAPVAITPAPPVPRPRLVEATPPAPADPVEPERKAQAAILPPRHVRYHCEPLPNARPVPIAEVRDHHCRWIVEFDGEERFCGARKGKRPDGEPSPYCPTHQRRAFRTGVLLPAAFIKSVMRWAR
ncbi:GcrA family cell cycle regulator [Caulobacter hibisci]|uniref:GcrA cell cycle regulator n=1 Tax=Caulobacter hibisci TaxID=2035993 RepID=A0ABS0SSN6_9CAUL|nr:GcrA family cell cycle regulator [Caulobacter hibisci]MBI1682356.1 hypothetical protein [Caulobacter hibisci]